MSFQENCDKPSLHAWLALEGADPQQCRAIGFSKIGAMAQRGVA
jgi:hypothetical protein